MCFEKHITFCFVSILLVLSLSLFVDSPLATSLSIETLYITHIYTCSKFMHVKYLVSIYCTSCPSYISVLGLSTWKETGLLWFIFSNFGHKKKNFFIHTSLNFILSLGLLNLYWFVFTWIVLFPIIYVKLALCGISTLMLVHFTNLFVKKSKWAQVH